MRQRAKGHKLLLGILLVLFYAIPAYAQKQDSIATKNWQPVPKKATIRSAILPGLGQAYNRSYWKIPIVWGALGTTGVVFANNLSTYKELKQAYIIRTDGIPGNDNDIPPEYRPLSNESIRYNRDLFRRYVDYAALFFLAFWGLNVVDATVEAHLKNFDVDADLSMRPMIIPTPNGFHTGVTVSVPLKGKKERNNSK